VKNLKKSGPREGGRGKEKAKASTLLEKLQRAVCGFWAEEYKHEKAQRTRGKDNRGVQALLIFLLVPSSVC